MNTMIVSGTVTALAAAITLVSGAVFKRAFDVYHQPATAPGKVAGKAVGGAPTTPARPQPKTKDVTIGQVKSEGQKGGVTAGYVETINQAPPK